MYGYGSPRRSNIEFSKVEVGVSESADMLSETAAGKIRKAKRAETAISGKGKKQVGPAPKAQQPRRAPAQPPSPAKSQSALPKPQEKKQQNGSQTQTNAENR
jgi:hypothetical protein